MKNYVLHYNKPNVLILIYMFFLAWRSPGSASLIPSIGTIAIFLFYRKIHLWGYLSLLAASIFMALLTLVQNTDLTGFIKVPSCLLAFFLMKSLIESVLVSHPKMFNRILKQLIWFVVAYLALEVILRIFYGDLFYIDGKINTLQYDVQGFFSLGIFYTFKDGSPFFTDSNFTGIFLFLWFIVFSHFKYAIFSKKSAFLLNSIFTTLTLFTFSRTAYFCVFVVYFGSKLSHHANTFLRRLIYGFISLSILVFLYLSFDFGAVDDGSLQTKFGIWASLIDNFMKIDVFNQLFGFGLTEGKFVYSYEYGKTSHALIPQLFGDIGLIGTLIYVSFLFLVLARVEKGLLYLVAIFLMGASLFDPWDPVMFAAMGILSAAPNLKKIEHNYPLVRN